MNDMSKKVEQKTGVKMDDIMKIANSISNGDLQDEKSLRRLVKRIGRLANKPVSKKKEDMIVDALLKNKQNLDMSTISKMMK